MSSVLYVICGSTVDFMLQSWANQTTFVITHSARHLAHNCKNKIDEIELLMRTIERWFSFSLTRCGYLQISSNIEFKSETISWISLCLFPYSVYWALYMEFAPSERVYANPKRRKASAILLKTQLHLCGHEFQMAIHINYLKISHFGLLHNSLSW